MKPRIAFFAAASLVATGMTLASNVSFGQRAGKFLADAFEIMGPISSLMSGIVKPNLEKQARVTGDYPVSAVSGISGFTSDTVAQSGLSQAPIPTSMIIGPVATSDAPAIQSLMKRNSVSDIRPGANNVPAIFSKPLTPVKTLQATLLDALSKGAPGSLSKDREDVWQFLNSRPGQFDVSKLILSDRSERVDKEVVGNGALGSIAAPIEGILNTTQLVKSEINGTTTANNLTAQSLLSKNSVAPVPVPASALVLVAGFASLFGVSLMAKKSKAKKSKKAAK
jgi:hypothetical protein